MIMPVLKEQMLWENWTEKTVRIQSFPHWNLWALALLPFKKCNILDISATFYICEFARQAPRNIDFEILVPLHFHKYSTCHVHLHHALKQIQSKEIRNPIAWGGAVALRKLPFDFPGLNSVQICKTKPAVCSNIISEYRETIKNVWEASY